MRTSISGTMAMLRVQGYKVMSSDSVGPQKTGPSMSTGRS